MPKVPFFTRKNKDGQGAGRAAVKSQVLDEDEEGNGGTPQAPPFRKPLSLGMAKRAASAATSTIDDRSMPSAQTPAQLKQKACYSDEVQLRLVNLIYDPITMNLFRQAGINDDEAHLLGLTRINSSREARYWAQQIAKEAAYNKYAKGYKCDWPVSRIQRVAFLLARRSIPGSCGPGFMLGVGLAQEQNIQKAEGDMEGDEF